ncbi:hypothetical protein RN001_015464 [Aquatica leii]|uniref:Uncharacterized protein n=1 Tax=Aquatica leii TaxID=1421715 RepID=A0AAN7SNI5_9COLE|nr:hypothetical protein RN001_015464 [Aquatica leii]
MQSMLINNIEIWRLLEVTVQCPLILVAFGIVFLPESPRWLIVKDQQATVWKILRELGSTEEKSVEDSKTHTSLFESMNLFKQPSLLLRFLLIAYLIICCQVALCVLEGLELNNKQNFNDININTFFSQAILLIFMGVLSYFVDKRTILFSTYFFLATCFSISTSIDSDSIDHVALMGGVICATVPRPIIFVYALELFPTTNRSTAIGSCCSLTAVTNLVYQLVSPFLETEELIIVAKTICCNLCIVSALLMLFSPVPAKELPNVLNDIKTFQFVPKYR